MKADCKLTNIFICVVVIDPCVAFCLDHYIEQAVRGQLLHRAQLSLTSCTTLKTLFRNLEEQTEGLIEAIAIFPQRSLYCMQAELCKLESLTSIM